MDDKIVEIACAWCTIIERKAKQIAENAARGVHDPVILKDLDDCAENLGYALAWLPLATDGNKK